MHFEGCRQVEPHVPVAFVMDSARGGLREEARATQREVLHVRASAALAHLLEQLPHRRTVRDLRRDL